MTTSLLGRGLFPVRALRQQLQRARLAGVQRPVGQPVRAVVWLLLIKRCPFELRAAWPKYGKTAGATASDVDDYTASVNPRGTIPAMDDDGYILWESHAIMIYLCEKHGWDDLWPADIRARGRVNNYLHFHHRNTR